MLQDGSTDLSSNVVTQIYGLLGDVRRNVPLTFRLSELDGQHPYLSTRGVERGNGSVVWNRMLSRPGFLKRSYCYPHS
jgi:hypothetical protein